MTHVRPQVRKWMTRDPPTFLSNVQTRDLHVHVLRYLHQESILCVAGCVWKGCSGSLLAWAVPMPCKWDFQKRRGNSPPKAELLRQGKMSPTSGHHEGN